MDDLISRQAVENITWEEPSYSDPLNVLTEVREKVRALPPVENKGEWLDDGFCGDCKCSVCKHEFDYDIANMRGFDFALPKFCPNCGAEMKGET